jgi:hypothetical protein
MVSIIQHFGKYSGKVTLFTLKMAAAIFVETLDNIQLPTFLTPESGSYTLYSSRENLRTNEDDLHKTPIYKMKEMDENADSAAAVNKTNNIWTSFRREIKKVIIQNKSGAIADGLYML